MSLGTHGVLVKTKDYPRGRWLDSSGGLTTRLVHAARAAEDRAERFAKSVAEDNPDVVEWARAEAF